MQAGSEREAIEVREIRHGSADYEREIALRNRILREPLGLRLKDEDLAKEVGDLHLGAFRGDRLVGCLILSPIGETTFKMRQVAVESSEQGSGVGRALVLASEDAARRGGRLIMELNARDTAVPFYLKLGYELIGEPFVEVSIPHRKMKKELSASAAGSTRVSR